VVVGVAGMDDERQAGRAGGRDMRLEPFALRRPVGLVVVIIEAAFADCDDTRVVGRLDQRRRAQIGMRVRLVRVDADGGPHVGLLVGNGDDVIPFALAGRDIEESGNSARARIG